MAGQEFTCETGDKIVAGDGIVITVGKTSTGRVRIGVEAPKGVLVRKGEDVPVPAPDLTALPKTA